MQKEDILSQLRVSYLPTPDELEDTKRELASLLAELASLAAEQWQLEWRIRALLARRDEIHKFIELKAAFIAPVRRIPDDVIQDIFLACLPTHGNAVMATSEAPLILCRICSPWRALALATPMIWASLHIPLAFILHKHTRTLAITGWLQRSAPYPLSLSICGPANFPSDGIPFPTYLTDPDHYMLLETLVKSAPRWRKISLSDLPYSYSRQLCNSSAPLLEVVRIKDDSDITQWSKLFSVSSVRTLDLEVALASEHTLILPALSHITHLSIAGHGGGGGWGPLRIPDPLVLGILQNLTQLVSLKIVVWNLRLPNETAYLPVLESLDLRASFTDVVHVSTNVIMPALLHLSVDSTEVFPAAPWMWATLSQHSPLVQSLDLTLARFTHGTFRETIRNFPSLVTLVVVDSGGWRSDDTPDTNDVLTLLAEPISTNVCPSLRTLEIRYSARVMHEILMRFLQARVDAGGEFRLKIVFEVLNNAVVIIPDVERFREQGIYVSIVSHTYPESAPTAWTGLPAGSE
ncbi:hypothetical protein C8R43DRAFT_443430 [Mycena crocata]|nr:hypothetical protein C8R43DRAFT_443430 [Mycena crocata]